MLLRFFDNLTEAQTAQVLGCATVTVKSTVSQAMASARAGRAVAELPERES